MAGKPIDIPITIDADGAEKGASNVTDAFEDVSKSLKDVNKAGEKTSKDLKSDMSDAAKKIDRDLTKALDEVEDKAKSTGKTVGREVKDGTDKAGEGFSELKDESASTAKEAAASFGSIEDAADALQEVAANAFVGFGPAGMAAGLVAAAGIGLAISALTDHADKINENKEKMLDLAQTIKDNGGALSTTDYIQAMDDYGYAIQDTKEFWEVFQSDAVSGFEEIRDGAEKAGVSIKDAFLGQFGSAEDAKQVLADLEAELVRLEDASDKAGYEFDNMGNMIDATDPAIQKQIEGNKELSEKVREHVKELEAANEIERIRRQAIEGTVEATLEDIAALERRNGVLQDGVTSELDYRDQVVETSKILAENGATLNINTQAGRDNQRALIDQSDAALQMAQSQLEAGTSADTVAASLANQRESILRQIDAITGSRAESEKLAAAMGLIPKEIITEVKTNGAVESKTEIETIPATKETSVTVSEEGTAAQTQATINAVEGKEVRLGISEQGTARMTQDTINRIHGKDVRVGATEQGTARQTQETIDRIKGKDIPIRVYVSNEAEFNGVIARMTAAATKTISVRSIEDPMTP